MRKIQCWKQPTSPGNLLGTLFYCPPPTSSSPLKGGDYYINHLQSTKHSKNAIKIMLNLNGSITQVFTNRMMQRASKELSDRVERETIFCGSSIE